MTTPPAPLVATVVRRARASDLAPVLSLLRDAGLSIAGVEEHFASFVVAEREGRVVGAMGLELRGTEALLRSAVVAPEARGGGVAAALFAATTELARAAGVRTLVLLTTAAEDYWARHGFRRITRDEAPVSVRVSAEFAGACPASAACMLLSLR
ncbi:MAG: GCN5-related N-acetyltransferase [Gemmatimonadetes bacterium]|jgi:amino-acid N-acetyltransferase|nr:GCN5-related N-acetyltransferase [Gemmatimonadota bacterium]